MPQKHDTQALYQQAYPDTLFLHTAQTSFINKHIAHIAFTLFLSINDLFSQYLHLPGQTYKTGQPSKLFQILHPIRPFFTVTGKSRLT
jgi:hypothetical protein